MTLAGVSMIQFAQPEKEGAGKAKRKYVCEVCSRAFKRSEHCIRHQRGHTQEKPFSCRFCRRKYSRKDLLVRHERTLHADKYTPTKVEKSDGVNSGQSKAQKTCQTLVESPEDITQIHTIAEYMAQDGETISNVPSAPIDKSTPIPAQKDHSQPSLKRRRLSNNQERDREVIQTAPALHEATAEFVALVDVSCDADINELSSITQNQNDAGDELPTLQDDMDLLDFFDPFFGLPLEQRAGFGLDFTSGLGEGFSPLEQSTISSIQSNQLTFKISQSTSHTNAPINSSQPHLVPPRQENSSTKVETNLETLSLPTTDGQENHYGVSVAPTVHRTPVAKQTSLVFTESMRASMLEDLLTRSTTEQASTFRLPSANSLQKCITSFIESFHIHLPLFHLQTFDLDRTPSPLTLAMCAIGALYRLERKVAASLYLKAEQALSSKPQPSNHVETSRQFIQGWATPLFERPVLYHDSLWKAQTRLLLTFFASFSGDPEVMSKAITTLGEFALDFRRLSPNARPRPFETSSPSWPEWVERECLKRLLYGHIMLSNAMAMTYGMPPGYSIVSDGNIEMPGNQSLWDASSAQQWQELVSSRGSASLLSVRDAVSRVMYGGSRKSVPDICWSWSPFACLVVINAVSIQVWHVTQGSYFFDEAGLDPSHIPKRSQILSHTEAALSRCRALITQARSDADYTWTEAEGPLLFNCLAILRVSYCRAFTGVGSADRMMLLKDSRDDILGSLQEFVNMPQDRNDFTTRAVARAYEGMIIPARAGAPLLRKTAAFTWAVEHALAGWDAALLVTKWVHGIEMDAIRGRSRIPSSQEEQLIQDMADLLSETGTPDHATSMAARLAEHWASYYDDTWVWGVTPRMGWILRALSNCYEDALNNA